MLDVTAFQIIIDNICYICWYVFTDFTIHHVPSQRSGYRWMMAVLFVANICGWVGGVQGGLGVFRGRIGGVVRGRRSHTRNTVCMQEIWCDRLPGFTLFGIYLGHFRGAPGTPGTASISFWDSFWDTPEDPCLSLELDDASSLDAKYVKWS